MEKEERRTGSRIEDKINKFDWGGGDRTSAGWSEMVEVSIKWLNIIMSIIP